MWNTDYDVDAGIAEYCEHAYSAACESMLQYIRETQDPSNYTGPDWEAGGYTKVSGFHEIGYSGSPIAHVKKEVLSRWDALLTTAEEAVADDAASLARVRVQHKWNTAYREQRQIAK